MNEEIIKQMLMKKLEVYVGTFSTAFHEECSKMSIEKLIEQLSSRAWDDGWVEGRNSR